jgi:hypothetical protein
MDCPFEKPVGAGPELDEADCTIRTPYGHMPNQFGPVVGKCVATEGKVIWSFTLRGTNPVGMIVVGAADASIPLTEKSGPPCTGFHIGKSKVVHSKTGHKIAGKRLLAADTPRNISGTGDLTILVIADMDRRRLSFAVGKQPPVDVGIRLPPTGVRPWVWLGGPNVGSVTLAEHRLGVPSPPLSDHSGGSDMTDRTKPRQGIGGDLPSMEDTAVGDETMSTISESTEDSDPSSDDKRTRMQDLPEEAPTPSLEPWSVRAAEWLAPLQLSFANLVSGTHEVKADARQLATDSPNTDKLSA